MLPGGVDGNLLLNGVFDHLFPYVEGSFSSASQNSTEKKKKKHQLGEIYHLNDDTLKYISGQKSKNC